jgi:hypothetical protein
LNARIVACGGGTLRLHFRYDADTQEAVEAALQQRVPAVMSRAA